MAAQRHELVTQQFNFVPTTLKEAQEYATIFANSGLCPESYRGRPNDILIVWQMGKELGLDKMQSLRTLGCINGMPFAYGDGLLALIKRHRDFEDMNEWFEGSIEQKNLTAFCKMKRRNQEPVIQSFSMEDAKIAGLWDKKGVWQQYRKRMLQHRARGFAAKDCFPDALYGLMSEHEARDISDSMKVVEIPVVKRKGMAGLEESLGLSVDEPEIIDAESEVINVSENTDNEKMSQLVKLIEDKKLSQKSIDAALKKAGAETLSDLTDEQMEKWINHLNNTETK